MRAQAMPGEAPETLPTPEALTPMFYEAITSKSDSVLRLAFRE